MLLPPGKTRVPQRLQMAGRFGLDDARFTNAQVQTKLQELSRRSQGKNKEVAIGRVLTDLRGRFSAKNGLLTLNDLVFQVPGATVALNGTYGLESGALDFAGTLRMDASVSRAVGGFKSIFLKPFDPLFRKDGAGAVVPIKIGGTREAPKMGMEMGQGSYVPGDPRNGTQNPGQSRTAPDSFCFVSSLIGVGVPRVVVEPHLHRFRRRDDGSGGTSAIFVLVGRARAAEAAESQADFELVAFARLGAEVDFGPREDEAFTSSAVRPKLRP